jgi:hypothetical protein
MLGDDTLLTGYLIRTTINTDLKMHPIVEALGCILESLIGEVAPGSISKKINV